MKKAIATKPGEIIIEEAEIPVPAPGEVLVKVNTIGICGSDIHVFGGMMGDGLFPLVQGHEMSGVIEDANGSAVFKNGDKVTMMSFDFCCKCSACVSGNPHHCPERTIHGVNIDGCAAEYAALPEQIVMKLPDDMPFDEGAMIEPLAVAVHACNIAGDLAGKKALVVGAGVIGNLVAQVARVKGADVMISNRSEYRLDFAREVGIEKTVATEKSDLTSAVAEAFGAEGADVVFECIGTAGSVNESFAQCARMGTVVILGVFGEMQLIDLFTMQDKELRVIGSALYSAEDFREAIDLAYEKKVLLAPIMTGEYPLEKFADAYEAIENRAYPIMKVLLKV